MFLANIDAPEVQNASIAFSNQQYPVASPGRIFVDGVKGNYMCNVLSNVYSVKKDNYKVFHTTCTAAFYGYCELSQPRGDFELDITEYF